MSIGDIGELEGPGKHTFLKNIWVQNSCKIVIKPKSFIVGFNKIQIQLFLINHWTID